MKAFALYWLDSILRTAARVSGSRLIRSASILRHCIRFLQRIDCQMHISRTAKSAQAADNILCVSLSLLADILYPSLGMDTCHCRCCCTAFANHLPRSYTLSIPIGIGTQCMKHGHPTAVHKSTFRVCKPDTLNSKATFSHSLPYPGLICRLPAVGTVSAGAAGVAEEP